MYAATGLDRAPEALLLAVQLSETLRGTNQADHRLRAVQACSIAISREAGALGTTVAREVGERLGWPVYDHELLERIAQRIHVPVRLVEQIDERPVSWLQECLETFAAVPFVREVTYVRQLFDLIEALGEQGRAVIVGRGAAHLLPSRTTLRVRLVAPLTGRIETIRREQGVSFESAARFVNEADAQRRRFIQDHFQKDADDPRHYDLLLNSSRCSIADCAELIIEALHGLQSRYARALQNAG